MLFGEKGLPPEMPESGEEGDVPGGGFCARGEHDGEPDEADEGEEDDGSKSCGSDSWKLGCFSMYERERTRRVPAPYVVMIPVLPTSSATHHTQPFMNVPRAAAENAERSCWMLP